MDATLLHSGAGVTSDEWRDIFILAVHFVAAVAWLGALIFVSATSWAIARSDDERVADGMRELRSHAMAPMWIAIAVLLLSGVYNQFNNVPWPLPYPWEATDASVQYMRSYTLLLFAKHVIIGGMLLGLVVVTWRISALQAVAQQQRDGALPFLRGGAEAWSDVAWRESGDRRMAERGVALISTGSLVMGAAIVAISAVLSYVHLLAHGH
ncbi:MAG: hypothetical protein HY873_11060 [Chloroflexi bacterium]|nr:hypothetical protein [Chloroflexota bacterium]